MNHSATKVSLGPSLFGLILVKIDIIGKFLWRPGKTSSHSVEEVIYITTNRMIQTYSHEQQTSLCPFFNLPIAEEPMADRSLCQRCQSINIASLFRGPRYESEEDMVYSENLDFRVASVAELREQKKCPLCSLLLNVYTYELTDHGADNGEEAEFYAIRNNPRKTSCKLRPTRADLVLFYDPCGIEDRIATHLLIEFDPAIPVLFHTWNQNKADGKQGEVSYPTLRYKSLSLYRGWSIALDHSSAVSGRPILNRCSQKNNMVDFGQLRSLLQTCRKFHPTCNERVEIHAQGLKTTNVMLLDVSTRVMVRANLDTRYIALSYVWDYVDREGYPGFKDGFPEGCSVPELPRIMEDSIAIVKKLGERYLWIDLLCIDQNNPVLKKIQIKQMDIVYSHAEFAIVVLARSNVHGGIPGIRLDSRKVEHHRIHVDAQDLVVATVWNHFYTIAGSTWNSRGWTLEEGMLSRRCIVFGPNEVYFDCASGVGSESIGLPVYHQSNQTSLSLKHSPRMIDYKFWNKAFPTEWNFDFFAQNVMFYSERDLSHSRDSLNAFLGVLSRLTISTHMGFVQGLPKDDLLKGLLWFPVYSSSRLSGFPSWTWAGWTGPRQYCDAYGEAIDKIKKHGYLANDPDSHKSLAHVAFLDDGNAHTHMKISSHVRHFSLRLTSSESSLYRLNQTNGELLLGVLGSTGAHDHENQNGYLFLDAHAASTSSLTHFLYLIHWKDVAKKRDHILAMIIKELDDGVFERAALCGIPVEHWEAAPIIEGLDDIILV